MVNVITVALWGLDIVQLVDGYNISEENTSPFQETLVTIYQDITFQKTAFLISATIRISNLLQE
jgi:hypothetical protein